MSDDYVDVLLDEQDNANALLLEILSSGYEEWDYIAAVEGPDDVRFYFDFVRDAVGESEVHFLRCGGKKPLLDFKNRAGEYPWVGKPSFLFLCDKDFDDYLGRMHAGVWYTETYSVESYVTGRSFIDYVVQKHSSKALKPADRKAFLDRYEDMFDGFANRLRAYSGFICEVRAGGEHPKFDLFGIECLFDLAAEHVRPRKGRLHAAITTMDINSQIDFKAMLKRAKSFRGADVRRWLRGKLALQVARKCYDIAVKQSAPDVREVLPGSTYVSRENLSSVYTALGPIPSLRLYCETAG